MATAQTFDRSAMPVRPVREPVATSSFPATSGPTVSSDNARDERRHLNVEGAYPLFLIGGALLVYGVLVALEVPPPTIGRFEIWQLVIVVGSTLVAAGLFSLYFALETPRVAPPPSPIEPPSQRSDRAHGRPPSISSASSPTASAAPPWWEGPPVAAPSVRSRIRPAPSVVSRAQVSTEPSPPPSASPVRPLSVSPERPSSTTEDEVANTLRELDAISREITSTSAATSRPPAKKPLARRCVDCDRPANSPGPGPMCSRCGRALCVECAEGSLLRTADVTCRSCLRAAPVGS